MKRPMAMLALAYAGGLLLAEYLPLPLAVLWGGALVLAGATLLWTKGRRWLLVPALVSLGWLNLTSHRAIISPNDLRLLLTNALPMEATLRGRLPETPSLRMYVRDDEESYRTLSFLDVEALRDADGWRMAKGRVLVLTSGSLPEGFHTGQRVEVSGVLATPENALAPGLFDYQRHLRNQGVYFRLRAGTPQSWTIVSVPPCPPPLTDRFLGWARGVLRRGLPEDDSTRLLWAMTLGWRTGLTSEVREPFMRSGTVHLFAISGLHMALIAGILVSLLRVLQLPRPWCGALVIPTLWFYAGATGWQSSAVRATVMMTVVIGGWALRRPGDLLNSLAAAAFLILLWSPQQLFQAGFQLSFFVVLSIALFLPPMERVRDRLLQSDPLLPPELLPRWRRWLNGPLRWLTTAAATSLAAWLGSLPLTAHYFHLFSPVTLLANLAIVPLGTLALMSCLGSLICGSWWPTLAELFNHSAWVWMWGMIRASEAFTDLPGAFHHVRSFTPPDMFLYYALLIGLLSGWLLGAARRRWTVPVACAIGLLHGGLRLAQRDEVTLTALPLSGGSALFCDFPGGSRDLLIDCGRSNAVEFVTEPFLHAQGVDRLPRLLVTHGDLQQMGGAERMLENFRVSEVLASGVRQRSPTYRRVLEGLEKTPSRLRRVHRGDTVGEFEVLHPEETDRFSQADDNAVVLRGNLGGTRVLLLSDLGRPGQEALMEREPHLRADVVIAGLPTQSEPLCSALLDRIGPKIVVILDSEFPATERASPALRHRLAAHGAKVFYARETGWVQVVCHDTGWSLRTSRGHRLEVAGAASNR